MVSPLIATKLFADDTSLFSVIHGSVITTFELNSYLSRIKEWAFQCKMSFNPDLNKEAQEVISSRKLKKVCLLLYVSTIVFLRHHRKNI